MLVTRKFVKLLTSFLERCQLVLHHFFVKQDEEDDDDYEEDEKLQSEMKILPEVNDEHKT